MTRTPERGPQCRVLPGKSSRTKLLARSQPAPSPPDLSLSIQMPWYLQVKVLGPKALGTGWSPSLLMLLSGPRAKAPLLGATLPVPGEVLVPQLSVHSTRGTGALPHAHAYTHTHTYTRHRCAQTHVHKHTAQMCKVHPCTDTHAHTCTAQMHAAHANMHTHTHGNAHMRVCTATQSGSRDHPRGARHARPGQQRALPRLQCWPVRPQQPRWGAGDFLPVGQKASGEKA